MKSPLSSVLFLAGALLPAQTASYVLTRDGCNGGPVIPCIAQNESPMTFSFTSNAYDYAFPVVNTAGGPITILGFELFTTSITNALESAPTFFYRDNAGSGSLAHSVPTTVAEATGTMAVGGVQNWWSTSVYPAPVVQPGEAFWIGFDPQARIAPPINASGLPGPAPMRFRRANINGNAWTVFTATGEAAFRLRCTTAAPVPLLQAVGLPRSGQPFSLQVDNGQPFLPAIVLFGLNTFQWAGGLLPAELSFVGGSGCYLYSSSNSALFLSADAQGVATFSFTVPSTPRLLGFTFYNQGAVFSFNNPLSFVVSNLGRGTIGL